MIELYGLLILITWVSSKVKFMVPIVDWRRFTEFTMRSGYLIIWFESPVFHRPFHRCIIQLPFYCAILSLAKHIFQQFSYTWIQKTESWRIHHCFISLIQLLTSFTLKNLCLMSHLNLYDFSFQQMVGVFWLIGFCFVFSPEVFPI